MVQKTVKLLILTAFVVVSFQKANAQYTTDNRIIFEHMRYSSEKPFNTWSIAIGYGPLIMYNDLSNYNVFPDHWKFGPNVMISKQLAPAFAFDLQFLSGDFVSGGNVYYTEGNLLDFSFNARAYINQMLAYPGPINDKWNFYLKLGVGLTAYRNRVKYTETDQVVHNRDFGTENEEEGYLVKGYDRNDPSKKTSRATDFLLPLGMGVQYRLSRSFDIGFESSIRLSIEDKLDNILVGAENDKYWSNSLNICYKIGKKDKRHSRWTYRGYGFNIFGSKKKDPLVDEINSVEEQLKKYSEGRVVKKDSVTLINNVQKIYGAAELVPVFFEIEKFNEIDMEALVDLATLALALRKNPSWTADIYGYSNEYDNDEENLEISRKRCERVLQYFVRDLGLEEGRFVMHVRGVEDVLPQDLNSAKRMFSVNRRVDVVLKK